MSDATTLRARVLAAPGVALGLYVCLLLAGGLAIWWTRDDLATREGEVAVAEEQLDVLRHRSGEGGRGARYHGLKPETAFVGGDKLTVAAAEVQRRVAASIVAAGGSVLSSQIERGEPKGQTADLKLAVDCEIEQTGLQRMLYDLESTTPFLFIEKLNMRIRNDQDDRKSERRLRIAMRMSAVWRDVEP